jgi:hypothetical protein
MRRSWLLLLGLTGCFALTDTGAFVPDEDCDLQLRVRSFSPHVRDNFIARLVQDQPDGVMGGPIQHTYVRMEPNSVLDIDFRLPNSVPALRRADQTRPRIEFIADANGNGMQDPPPTDHSWILQDACSTGPELFPHTFEFQGVTPPEDLITQGTDLVVRVCGSFDNAVEVHLETTVPSADGEPEQVRATGLVRVASFRDRGRDIVLPGVVDSGFQQTVKVFFDNGDGAGGGPDAVFQPSSDEGFEYVHRPDSIVFCADRPLEIRECTVMRPPMDPVAPCIQEDGTMLVVANRIFGRNEVSEIPSWIDLSPPIED